LVANAYQVLGVERDASDKVITRAYRERVLVTHPDRGGSNEGFIAVQGAYEELRNPLRRAVLDAELDLCAKKRTKAGARRTATPFKVERSVAPSSPRTHAERMEQFRVDHAKRMEQVRKRVKNAQNKLRKAQAPKAPKDSSPWPKDLVFARIAYEATKGADEKKRVFWTLVGGALDGLRKDS